MSCKRRNFSQLICFLIFTHQVNGMVREKKYNSITTIDEIPDIFFWNPSFSHRISELLRVSDQHYLPAPVKSPCKAELLTPGNPWIFLESSQP